MRATQGLGQSVSQADYGASRVKNLSLTAWDPTNLPKNLSLSSDLLRS